MLGCRFIGIAVFAVALCGAASGNENLELSRLRDWTLVLADDASPAERYAAEEFRSLLREATGIDLSIGARRARGRVYIGPGAALRKSGIGFDTANYGEEEFRIRIGRNAIAIAGGRPRGTLYGVYEFAEQYLGVRFLTADHTYIPKGLTSLPLADVRRAPAFAYRWSYCKEASAFPEFAARLRLNTLTHDEKFGGVTHEKMESHTLFYQVPADRYRKTHPEYFALVDGRRMLEAPGGGPQVCPSNPDVADIVTKFVLDDLAAHPELTNVCVSTNDNPFFCTCDACRALNEREESPAAAHLALLNTVAERIERVRPGVKVATLAYWYTQNPPKTLRARHNVRVWFCPFGACAVHRLDDPACPRNAPLLKDLDGWRAACSDLRIWYYNTDLRTLDLPFLNLRSLGPNLRMFKERGMGGAFLQGNDKCFAGEFADLRNYVSSRLLWNPELDGDALREEFLRLHYGPAAEPIRACIDLLHDRAEQAGAHPYCWIDPVGSGIDGESAARMHDYFEEALALAPDETIRARVEKLSLAGYKAMFETRGRLVFDAGRVRLEYPAGVLDSVPHYRELCERYGMTFDSEIGSRDDFLENLGRMVAGTRAERIENAAWRVTLLPGLGGLLVDLYNKPASRQWLEAWDHPNINLPTGTWGWRFSDDAVPEKFTSEVRGNRVTAVAHLQNGSTGRMTIHLADAGVEFEAAIHHLGAEPGWYRFSASGDLDVNAAADLNFAKKPSRLAWPTPYKASTSPPFAIEIEAGQLELPEMDAEPGLRGARIDVSSPEFPLLKGGLWRTRFRLRTLPETAN
ncbi:MAG: DUF4838 domain-containing protein [FCB group bacterium]|nr:DUF4838 domain-containing protein [FCB group bacterium]